MSRDKFLAEYIMKGLPVLLENCLQSPEDYAMRVSPSLPTSQSVVNAFSQDKSLAGARSVVFYLPFKTFPMTVSSLEQSCQ